MVFISKTGIAPKFILFTCIYIKSKVIIRFVLYVCFS